jgi:hypothetical protein
MCLYHGNHILQRCLHGPENRKYAEKCASTMATTYSSGAYTDQRIASTCAHTVDDLMIIMKFVFVITSIYDIHMSTVNLNHIQILRTYVCVLYTS